MVEVPVLLMADRVERGELPAGSRSNRVTRRCGASRPSHSHLLSHDLAQRVAPNVGHDAGADLARPGVGKRELRRVLIAPGHKRAGLDALGLDTVSSQSFFVTVPLRNPSMRPQAQVSFVISLARLMIVPFNLRIRARSSSCPSSTTLTA